ncbi:sensor histidine kinase [Cohnella sp. JJ-181]|uniref:sensor histidine kinase n=1 Tax=Cohnella rhizoplanae TaxID=2974897 RepID=UPI0022FF618F|nr:HAMP domain-containing sensor histidine kinase [Cohnella sp. JJ-181]CAI6052775.1 Adaptive-response sensory-kinase SasA [Cohnella sp. JJ-181]
MSIKFRLVLSYVAMTVIPVILFALIATSVASLLFKTPGDGSATKIPASWSASSRLDELTAGVKFMAETDPDRYGDVDFLAKTTRRLQEFDARLVIAKDGAITYASPEAAAVSNLYRRLQEARPNDERPSWGKKKIDGKYSVVKYDFRFGDGSAGEAFVLYDMSTFFGSIRSLFLLGLAALLAVVALTNGILTLLVSRSLIRPLNALQQAAGRIKDGQLDQRVDLRRKDEIGRLGEAFEAMRVRLNDSIRLQLQYEDNRKELIANISHDLKTPIAGIKACVEGIQDGIADTGPKRDKYIGMIAKKANDMDRLIDELFLFSKLDLNRLPFQIEPTDLGAYLADCAEELRADPRMAGIGIVGPIGGAGVGAVRVQADREKLRRVLMNVVENSLKYMDKPLREIVIGWTDGDGEATVRIADNGAGIAPDALPHVFDRFYRAELSRSTDTGGSGLGLAIVKQIVEGQGGRVWAESREGEWTSICFTLKKTETDGVRP